MHGHTHKHYLKEVDGISSKSIYASQPLKKDIATYYRLHFAALDTAMRRIYTDWLNDPATLRPLQEHYTILNNELLTCWFEIKDNYISTQKDIVTNALSGDKRTAVIVCDGLRLEIAEAVVKDITDKNVKIDRKTALTVLYLDQMMLRSQEDLHQKHQVFQAVKNLQMKTGCV